MDLHIYTEIVQYSYEKIHFFLKMQTTILPGLIIVEIKKKYNMRDWDHAVTYYILLNNVFNVWKNSNHYYENYTYYK